ncbi:MAG: FAD-dependent monooxygenase, partial [Kiloniellales bacterium]
MSAEDEANTKATEDCEVLIVGGGLVGLTLGVALASAGIETVVVDREDPARTQGEAFDGRASAIARGPQQALAALGIWPDLAARAQPILEIRVSDGQVGRPASPLFLHYDRAEVDGLPLGYMLENRDIRRALYAAVGRQARLRLVAPASVAQVERGAVWAQARLEGGARLRARLVVAADGPASPLRRTAGIAVTAWDYRQVGLVATVAHAEPHLGVAHEHFLPSGPFAMLPLIDGPDDAGRSVHRSSIVWTERPDVAAAMLRLEADCFAAEMTRRFGDSLGRLALIGRRWSYPLSLSYAQRVVDHRLALLGDAAHRIHPIAGQGLNLGLRDAAALAEVLAEAARRGEDIGDLAVLRRYQQWRRFDSTALAFSMDALNRLFS